MCYTIYNSRMAVPKLMIFLFFGFVSGPNNRINIKKFKKSQKKFLEKTRLISPELIFTWLDIYINKRKSQNVCVTPFITQERLLFIFLDSSQAPHHRINIKKLESHEKKFLEKNTIDFSRVVIHIIWRLNRPILIYIFLLCMCM